MPRVHLTPWKHDSDLLAVRAQFYGLDSPASDAPDPRRRACAQVWVWQDKGSLPHAVEATALLTDA
ncbi:rRNA-processing protein las1, partial [Ascosphaera acerosa]